MPINPHAPDTAHTFNFDLDTILVITRPLGIPWHCVKDKGQDFSTTFGYSSFLCNLCSCTIMLPEKKHSKAVAKLTVFMATASSPILYPACESLHGTLQHITFMYRDGRLYLPHLSTFLSKFPNNFTQHHIPLSILNDLHWWSAVLTGPLATCSLVPHQKLNPDVWADALTSWGIGLIVGDCWAAWWLQEGWKTGQRDIGWAESVALELAIVWAVHARFCDATLTVRDDNTGIIGAYAKGHSHNAPHNDTLHRIAASLFPFNLNIVPLYVTSSANWADPTSQSILGHSCLHLPISFKLPPELQPILTHV